MASDEVKEAVKEAVEEAVADVACRYCGREIQNPGARRTHEVRCPKNPDSPTAEKNSSENEESAFGMDPLSPEGDEELEDELRNTAFAKKVETALTGVSEQVDRNSQEIATIATNFANALQPLERMLGTLGVKPDGGGNGPVPGAEAAASAEKPAPQIKIVDTPQSGGPVPAEVLKAFWDQLSDKKPVDALMEFATLIWQQKSAAPPQQPFDEMANSLGGITKVFLGVAKAMRDVTYAMQNSSLPTPSAPAASAPTPSHIDTTEVEEAL